MMVPSRSLRAFLAVAALTSTSVSVSAFAPPQKSHNGQATVGAWRTSASPSYLQQQQQQSEQPGSTYSWDSASLGFDNSAKSSTSTTQPTTLPIIDAAIDVEQQAAVDKLSDENIAETLKEQFCEHVAETAAYEASSSATTTTSPLTDTAEAVSSQQSSMLQQIESLQYTVDQQNKKQVRLVTTHEKHVQELEQQLQAAITTDTSTIQQRVYDAVTNKDKSSNDFEQQLERAMADKEAAHSRRVATLSTAHSDALTEYKSKLESIATEYQDFKTLAQQELKAAKQQQQAVAPKEATGTSAAAISIDEDELSKKAKEYTTVLSKLQKNFCKAKTNMEQAIVKEETARAQEQSTAANKLGELKAQVVQLQQREERIRQELDSKKKLELTAKDTTYKWQIARLEAARTRELQQLQTKLGSLAAEYQDFKFWTHAQQMTALRSNTESFDAMSDHVASSESVLQKQVSETMQAEKRADDVRKERRIESEAKIAKLQAKFAKTLQQTEDAQALVEESLARDEHAAEKKLAALQLRVDASEKDKVQSFFNFQDELAASKDLYEKRMIQLHFAKDKEIHDLQTRLESMLNEWQDYKLTTQVQQAVDQEAVVLQHTALLQQIATLNTQLQEQTDSATAHCSRANDECEKRTRLGLEMHLLKEQTEINVQSLESKLANVRTATSKKLVAMKTRARKQVATAEERGEAKANRFKTDLTNLMEAVDHLTSSVGDNAEGAMRP